MLLDFFAYIILGSFWIFGGAVFFAPESMKYLDVVKGWFFLNALIVFLAAMCLAIIWAFERLLI